MRPLLLFLSASGASAQWGLGANVGYHAQPFSNVLLPWEPLTEAPATANPVDAPVSYTHLTLPTTPYV